MTNERQALNRQLAQMLKGGVIMDVTTPEQAKIAEEAGACAVMALERIPADIRAAGGVSRMSDPKMIRGIQEAVTIPVMAKCRIGHIAEAQILQAIEIDYIDESEVLSPADNIYHIDKTKFDVPFVCGAKNLGEAHHLHARLRLSPEQACREGRSEQRRGFHGQQLLHAKEQRDGKCSV